MFYKGSAISGNGGGGSGDAVWGSITGTLSDQTDLADALAAKLTNTATGTNSLSIGGTATTAGNATNIGATSNVTGNYSTALGYGAGVTSGATRAIQIGEGTNDTSNTLSIGFGSNNYRLLDGSTGKIPNARLGAFMGATAQESGTGGGVPAPTTSDVGKFLSADGTWANLDLTAYQTTANLTTSLSNASTDTQYPSAKCVYDLVGDVESLLAQV